MGVGGAEVGIPGVQVRVEVDHGHRAVHRGDRAEHRQRHGVIPAEGQHEPGAFEQGACAALDGADRVVDVERIHGEVRVVAEDGQSGRVAASDTRHWQARPCGRRLHV
jgi:hypothetical protein